VEGRKVAAAVVEAVVEVVKPAEEITALPVEFKPAFTQKEPGHGKKLAPALADVVRLLRSPQFLPAAVVLREVLDAPLCRRPRRQTLFARLP
jgi:hypothetical protein